MEYNEWLEHGVENGWLSIPVCYFHDILPLTEEEETEIEESGETCLPVSRFYEDKIGGNNGTENYTANK